MRPIRQGSDVRRQGHAGGVLAPIGKTRLEVQRNYQEALTKAGFFRKYSCNGDACGRGTRIVEPLIGDARRMRQIQSYGGYSSIAFLVVNNDEAHYIWGTIRTDGHEDAVSVLITTPSAIDTSPLNDRVGIFVQVVEPKAMETAQVTVDVNALQKDSPLTERSRCTASISIPARPT